MVEVRKQEGRLTNKRHFSVEEVTKLGKRKRGIMDQLMTLETSRKHFAVYSNDYKQRPGYYHREVKHGGRKQQPMAKKEPRGYGVITAKEEAQQAEEGE